MRHSICFWHTKSLKKIINLRLSIRVSFFFSHADNIRLLKIAYFRNRGRRNRKTRVKGELLMCVRSILSCIWKVASISDVKSLFWCRNLCGRDFFRDFNFKKSFSYLSFLNFFLLFDNQILLLASCNPVLLKGDIKILIMQSHSIPFIEIQT